MPSTFETFNALHQSGDLFVLPNVWNAKSALVFQEKKFPAVATSSAAVANSLGYGDGEEMPFSDYLFVIKRILAGIQIPLTVDMEMGYGTSVDAIYNNLMQLIELGVAGINIEDSVIQSSGRVLKEAATFAQTIALVKNKLEAGNAKLFINIRCDTYILDVENKQQETINRLKLYETTGANGIFLPCICAEEDIAQAVHHTRLPLNVMCIPGIPGFDTLRKLGVKRVSMGPFLFNKVYDTAGQLAEAVVTAGNFSPIFS